MVIRPLAEVQLSPHLPGVAWPLLPRPCRGAGVPRCSSSLALNLFMLVAIFTLSGSLLYSSTTLFEKNSLLTSSLAGGLDSKAWYPLWPLVDVAVRRGGWVCTGAKSHLSFLPFFISYLPLLPTLTHPC